MNPSISRTSSLASVVSDEGSIASAGSSEVKRTRKRFTNVQLMMLDQVYHETSHPTRELREKLSRDADLELRSVTVWFQNKRQTERRVALTNATSTRSQSPSMGSSKSLPTTNRNRKSAPSPATRLSLDHIASRSEHRTEPHTPTRKTPSSDGALWETMPSSPVEPPSNSPEATRVFVEFGKGKLRRTKTLEWACAAARLADKEGKKNDDKCVEGENIGMVLDEEGDTEDEDHEAVTPYSSFTRETPVRSGGGGNEVRGRISTTKDGKDCHDEETMNAAIVLCGLRQ